MIEPLRRIEQPQCFEQSEAIEKEYACMERRERYERERDAAHGMVELTAEIAAVTPAPQADIDIKLVFWEILRECDTETALYLVLRCCLGYSIVEIAAGLDVPYTRVKYVTRKAAKKQRRKAAL